MHTLFMKISFENVLFSGKPKQNDDTKALHLFIGNHEEFQAKVSLLYEIHSALSKASLICQHLQRFPWEKKLSFDDLGRTLREMKRSLVDQDYNYLWRYPDQLKNMDEACVCFQHRGFCFVVAFFFISLRDINDHSHSHNVLKSFFRDVRQSKL